MKPKTSLNHLIKLGQVSESGAIADDVNGGQVKRSSQYRFNRKVVANVALLAIVASPLVWCGSQMGLINWKVTMALAGDVAQELSPIRSWSNNNYEI